MSRAIPSPAPKELETTADGNKPTSTKVNIKLRFLSEYCSISGNPLCFLHFTLKAAEDARISVNRRRPIVEFLEVKDDHVPGGLPLLSFYDAASAFWEAEQGESLGLAGHAELITQRRGDTVEQGRIFQITDQVDIMATAQHRRMEDLRHQPGEVPARAIPPQPFNLSNAEGAVLFHQRLWVSETAQRDMGRILDAQTGAEHDKRSLQDEILLSVARNRLLPTDLVAAIDEWMKLGGVPLVPQPRRRRRLGIRSSYLTDGGYRAQNVNQPPRVSHGSLEIFSNDQQPISLSREDRVAVMRQARPPLQDHVRRAEIQDAGARREYFTGSRRGYLLDDRRKDNQPASPNCPDPSKLWLEYVRGGFLKTQFFPSEMWTISGQVRKRALPFRWHDDEEENQLEGPHSRTRQDIEFDWSNKTHVSRLNRWRSQRQFMITGKSKKDQRSYPFNKYENQWLTEQDAMHIEEQFYHEAGQNALDDEITNRRKWDRAMEKFSDFKKFPIRLTKSEMQDLTERFNATFAGKRYYQKKITREFNGMKDYPTVVTKDMSQVGFVPRPARSEIVIAMQRRRLKASAKRYLITLNMPKEADKDKFYDELSSEDDSDFASDR
ncbi:hypothetical protein LTR84_006348 [Exophiala bonariae]|uniref:Uncharacterized protein n=1 Tax=Exophiala bonariae TaxID=1690606 RepID=A0AAV9N0Z3_9EURO|nr:hypothetical protein LTR84_006348 [Exophiala bonariae]